MDGKEVTGPGRDRAVVFQQYALFPWRTAAANVSFGLEGTGSDGRRLSRKERADKAREYPGARWAFPASRTGIRMSCPAA